MLEYIPVVVAILAALAEPSRFRIVDLLLAGPCAVGEIALRLRMAQPQVSKHLRRLKAAGLVEAEPRAQRRLYALRPEPLQALDTWIEPYRRLWSTRLDALERHLEHMDDRTPRTSEGGES